MYKINLDNDIFNLARHQIENGCYNKELVSKSIYPEMYDQLLISNHINPHIERYESKKLLTLVIQCDEHYYGELATTNLNHLLKPNIITTNKGMLQEWDFDLINDLSFKLSVGDLFIIDTSQYHWLLSKNNNKFYAVQWEIKGSTEKELEIEIYKLEQKGIFEVVKYLFNIFPKELNLIKYKIHRHSNIFDLVKEQVKDIKENLKYKSFKNTTLARSQLTLFNSIDGVILYSKFALPHIDNINRSNIKRFDRHKVLTLVLECDEHYYGEFDTKEKSIIGTYKNDDILSNDWNTELVDWNWDLIHKHSHKVSVGDLFIANVSSYHWLLKESNNDNYFFAVQWNLPINSTQNDIDKFVNSLVDKNLIQLIQN